MPSLEAVRATEAAFVADVCRHPGDDTPRLIFADWLDEHGEGERAEFIRVQIKLARYPRAPAGLSDGFAATRWREHREALRRRERELLEAHGLAWATPPGSREGQVLPLATFPSGRGYDQWPRVLFRRGFVEEFTLPATPFLAHAAALFRAAPVRRVTLFDREPSQYPGLSGREWWYWSVTPPVSADPRRVPLALWNLLEAHERGDDGVPLWCSRTAAVDALAAACLLYGRRAAWPCPECKGRGRNGAVPSLPGWPCPACAGRGHTVEEG